MMIHIGSLQLDFGNPWLIVPGVLLLVSLWLSSRAIYRRLFHRSAPHALAVLLLNAIAYAVVVMLLLEPKVSSPGGRSVLLVTEGADLKSAPLPGTGKVYVAPAFTASPGERRDLSTAGWLLETGQLKYREAAISRLEVRGYGLERAQWETLGGHPEIVFEAPAIDGFNAMRWQRYLTEGDVLRVTGQYGERGDDRVVHLLLLDPAGNTAAEGRFKHGLPFTLEARVKTRGLLEYRLQARDAGEILAAQILPFESGAGNDLDIMIVQSAPSFETRQLKDFAAADGHRIRLSTTISKDKYIWQSANLPAATDTGLSPAMLAGQDILIMDGRAFTALPSRHEQWLSDAVAHGLGLLLLADSSLLDAFGSTAPGLLQGFELKPANGAETTVIPRSLAGGERDWKEPVTAAAMQLDAWDGDVVIAADDGRNLVVSRPFGLGNIGISLIRDSHGWLTAGNRSQWSDYWTLLLSALTRQRDDSYLLPAPDADFYRVNQRTPLCAMIRDGEPVIGVTEIAPNGRQTPLELKPAADTLHSSRRCAFFWPRAGGWHRIVLSDGNGTVLDRNSVYVFSGDQWLDQQRAERARATRAWAAGDGSPSATATDSTATEPLDRFWLWLALVLAASLLWLERKLDFT